MQIPAISATQSNNQSFQGKVNIVNDLSYLPCKYVRTAYDSISKMVEDKPFDIFIKQNHKDKSLSFIAKRPEHVGLKNKPVVEYSIANASEMDNQEKTTDLYISVAKQSIEDYNKKFPPKTIGERIADSLDNFRKKFVKLFQDSDEI